MKLVTSFFKIVSLLLVLVIGTFVLALSKKSSLEFAEKNQIAKHFLLTDYCFTTESRHTRNIALPELIAPFQDLPGYHDHFPSSSFYKPFFLENSK